MEGEAYQAQHDHYQRAAAFIRQALELDEQSSKIILIIWLFIQFFDRESGIDDFVVSTRYSRIRKSTQYSCRC